MAIKSTGIVRKIDELGRLVLPKELRNVLQIKHEDPMEIYVDGDTIMIKKYQPTCIFCGSNENLTEFGEKMVCKNCIDALCGKEE